VSTARTGPVSTGSYLVIGAGLAGSATAWRLAERGYDVTLVEATRPANDRGSSHGSARIFRYAYPHSFYTRLVIEAREAWDELEDRTGTELVRRTGALDFGPARDPRRLAEVLAGEGVDHELLSQQAAAERWPGVRVEGPVLWHPGAGVLDAELAVLAMTGLAVAAGATLHTNWPVADVRRSATGYQVVSRHGQTLRADQLVICAGAWLPDLLGALPEDSVVPARMPPLQVRKEQVYHFPYRDQGEALSWPTFIHKRADISTYSLPGGRDAGHRGQKLAEYNGGPVVASAADSDGLVEEGNCARVVAYVERFVPGLVPEPYAETTCLFTCTPSEDFLVDGHDGITVVSPCSGHGAKFAPLLGRIAADAATGRPGVPERFSLLQHAS
jgi:sarcosine oxidase